MYLSQRDRGSRHLTSCVACALLAMSLPADQAAVSAQPPGTDSHSAQPPGGRLIKHTYTSAIDGAELAYAVWLPPEYASRTDWPMIVFLHGSGEGGGWVAPTKPSASIPVREELDELPFVVVFPLMRGSWSISTLAERDVLDVVADAQAKLEVDPNRVHLVGLSLGGFAAWRIACRYPDLFASLSIFCGGGEPDLAVNLRHVPVRVWHGTRDSNVPVERGRALVAALRAARLPVEYVEIPAKGHVIWQEPLRQPEFYAWLAAQRRVVQPRRVSYRTHSLRYAGAYWAKIESLVDPALPGLVDVFIPPDEGIVVVHAENVARLRLDPPPELLPRTKPVHFVVDQREVQAKPTEQGWELELVGADQKSTLRKRPGLAGPIQDVLFDRFVVVVAEDEQGVPLPAWQAAAEQAFAWRQQPVTEQIPIIPVSALTDEMRSSAHLICFGNASNHAVLANLADITPLVCTHGHVFLYRKLMPIDLSAFVLVYPRPDAPGRYVVACSGLPRAVGHLAQGALTPSMLNPPPTEDLLLLDVNGRILTLDGTWEPQSWRAVPMGTRLPQRGFIFDRKWQLPTEVRDYLHELGETDPPNQLPSTPPSPGPGDP